MSELKTDGIQAVSVAESSGILLLI